MGKVVDDEVGGSLWSLSIREGIIEVTQELLNVFFVNAIFSRVKRVDSPQYA